MSINLEKNIDEYKIKGFTKVKADLNRGDLLCFNHLIPHGRNLLNKDYIRWSVDIRYEPTDIATGLAKTKRISLQKKTGY